MADQQRMDSFPSGGLVRACQPIHEHSHMHGDTAVSTPARYSRPERTRFSTVTVIASRQSAHRGNGFRQCGQEDSLCMVVAFPRRRASSCSAIETFLPQKLHNKNTDRELRGGDRMLPSVMSSWDRCSHKPHTSSMSRYVAIQYCTR
uniref:Uncharacterized protein n=1 Tax=Anopheles merus TaxID=30066 RepID=A0A182URW6_ANOME